jgi:hypothetical protein
MITIHYKGNLEKIRTAVSCANSIFQDPLFYQTIRGSEGFDMADISTAQIADLIYTSELSMRVVMYIASPRVHGYDDSHNPDLIHINVFRGDWTISSIVNTIVHQTVHAVNSEHPGFKFVHGDRNGMGKENTAPYWIASCAEEMITGKPGRTAMIHEAPPESLALDTLD